jgi:hypothetical protein
VSSNDQRREVEEAEDAVRALKQGLLRARVMVFLARSRLVALMRSEERGTASDRIVIRPRITR